MKKRAGWMIGLWMGLALCATFAQEEGVKVNVPFQFSVAGKALPAGIYVFSSRRDRALIRNTDGSGVAMALVSGLSAHRGRNNGQVVFRCYGKQCFLSQLWSPSEDVGHQLVKSREEEEAARREPGVYFALVGAPSRK